MASKVFSFGSGTAPAGETAASKKKAPAATTWKVFDSDAGELSAEHPVMVLDNAGGKIGKHVEGHFADLDTRSTFDFTVGRSIVSADILLLDSRFVSLLGWLRENSIGVCLSGQETAEGYAVTQIREVESHPGMKVSAGDGFLQYVISRLLETKAPVETASGDEDEDDSDDMKVTSLQTISDFLDCAKSTLPANIRKWARRNLAVARSEEVGPEDRRHAQHALSVMLNIRWQDSRFEDIDPVKAREILDEALYGMEKVKQRIIETIIQINRTHKLPAYGLLLIGPAGTGKSQIAYAVAKILGLPWTSLDMSSIHDSEQLTGSSRVYANARPGSIMDAYSMAGGSNLVFIINELDKADSETVTGNPADALLTLLDNLGFTDNYMECTIPTDGVYPIATANDKDRISEPLMTRFAVIEIPDYTPEEKKNIFLKYSLPRVRKRIGLEKDECFVTEEAADVVVAHFSSDPGVRDLEQAAEHLAANALYRIETQHVKSVTFDAEMTKALLE